MNNRKCKVSYTMVCISMFIIIFAMAILLNADAATVIIPNDYPTIQQAVNAANTGDTVYVHSGTYNEHVTIDKSITLQGESKNTTTINAGGTGDAIYISVSNVTIKGIKITNGQYGIRLLTDYTISYITINDCIVTLNGDGIYGRHVGGHFTIENCELSKNKGSGILAHQISDSVIRNCKVLENGYEPHNVDWDIASGFGIDIAWCSNSLIANCDVYLNKGYDAIILNVTSNCIIENCHIHDNDSVGIRVDGYQGQNNNNTIRDNIIERNNYGIGMGSYNWPANNNLVYHNNIIYNSMAQAWSDPNNRWDNGYPSGGNYWSDYTGLDSNSDGIGDIPYLIASNGIDNYPLMSATYSYTITATAGANGSISPAGAVTVNSGGNQSFTITPVTGYHIADVLVDSLSVGEVGSYTFTNVISNHVISANFAINTPVTIIVPNNYPTIQQAVNAANTGDTVYVRSGTYNEHVTISKSITFQGEDKNTTIINSSGTGDAIYISVSNVTIKGIKVTNGQYGIRLIPDYTINHITINDCIATSNTSMGICGGHVGGYITIENCEASNNGSNGIYSHQVSNSVVKNCKVFGNGWDTSSAARFGIDIAWCSNSSIINCEVYSNNAHHAVILDNTSNCTMEGCRVWNNEGDGVRIQGDYNTIQDNIVEHNGYGAVYSHNGCGIVAPGPPWSANNSLIYRNSIVSNSIQAVDGGSNNRWDNESGGNYWSDYTGLDSNSDGKGDIPYLIATNGRDNYPLMTATYTYTITATAGANGSISPSGAVTVNPGRNQSFTITPVTGYHIADVLVDSLSVGAVGSHTFTNVISNHTISANFAINTPATIKVPDDYPTIQQAVNAANPGDTVYVRSGTYNEHVTIGKSITLQGENKNTTTINADGTGDAIYVSVSNVTIKVIKITNGQYGIRLEPDYTINHITIYDCIVTANTSMGICGGHVGGYITIENCEVSNNTGDGIYAHQVSNSIIRNCQIFGNGSSYRPAIDIAWCSNSSIINCDVYSNRGAAHAIVLDNTTQCIVEGCHIWDHDYDGIRIYGQQGQNNNNTVRDNIIERNLTGIQIGGTNWPASNNLIYHNYIINNKFQANIYNDTNNRWDNGYPSGGNYWSDYTGTDSNGDGIGDTPYLISANNKDNYPLMTATYTYTITATAGANGSISPSGAVTVNPGRSQAFTIAPGTGYHIVDVVVDNVSQGAITSYTFSNVTANHAISASFAIDTFTITASSDANGSITPSGAVVVNYGGSQTYAILANTGYHIVDVVVDTVSQGAITSYTFSNVTADRIITAIFEINVPAPTTGRIALHSYTEYDDEIRDGYRSLDGVISIFDLQTNSHYQIAEQTISNGVLHAMNPKFSRDGSKIVFMGLPKPDTYDHNNDSWANYLDIFVYDFRYNTLVNLSRQSGMSVYGSIEEDPSFHPDGQNVIFKRNRTDLWTINTNTFALSRVTSDISEESGPSYSPDGQWLTYWVGAGNNADIYRLDTSNMSSQILVGNSGIQDMYPSYIDSNHLLYSRWSDEIQQDDEIYVMDIGNQINHGALFNSTANDSDPFVINDSWVGFSSSRSGIGGWDIFLGNINTGETIWLETASTTKHDLGGSFTTVSITVNTYTVTATAGDNGGISPASAVVGYGATPTFTITPNAGYDISEVKVGNISVMPEVVIGVNGIGTYTFPSVTTNHTISATFVIDDTIQIQALCPVDLIVTDSQGRIISRGTPTEWGSYTEVELDNDNDPDIRVIIPNAVNGNYSIEVVPKNQNATGTYTLQVLHGDVADNPLPITIVTDEPIQDAPPDGYSFSYMGNTVTVPPIIKSTTTTTDPIRVNSTITANASFTDPDVLDTHTAIWNWGDSKTSSGGITVVNGSKQVSGNHIYTTAGVYTISLTVTDSHGGSDTCTFQYVVVYDPDAGFVTGGGWINSPVGAYVSNPTLIGKANFGFNSKYKKGANTPTGETEFSVASMNFHSTEYELLVVAGANAKYKGSGTINNAGNYGFMLTATDGQINGGGGVDKFRIKIWDKATGTLVYDNKMGVADDSNDAQAIGGGSIVIHKDDKPAAPVSLPTSTRLLASFPNPANPEVWVPYQLDKDTSVIIRIYDLSGRLVRTLDLGNKIAGFYDTVAKAAYWDGRNEAGENVTSGIYFYNIQAGSFTAMKKLVILK